MVEVVFPSVPQCCDQHLSYVPEHQESVLAANDDLAFMYRRTQHLTHRAAA